MGALRALLTLPLAVSSATVLHHHSEPGAGGSSLSYCMHVLSGDLVPLIDVSEAIPSAEYASRRVEALLLAATFSW